MKKKYFKLGSLGVAAMLICSLVEFDSNIIKTKADTKVYATDPQTAGDDELVNIPDPGLRAAIESKLGKSSGADITVGNMKGMTGTLNAYNRNISDITGIEYAVNIVGLWLDNNQISNIEALSGLTNLTSFD